MPFVTNLGAAPLSPVLPAGAEHRLDGCALDIASVGMCFIRDSTTPGPECDRVAKLLQHARMQDTVVCLDHRCVGSLWPQHLQRFPEPYRLLAAMEARHQHKATMAPKKRAWPLMCLVVLGFGQRCFVQGWPVPMKYTTSTSKIQRCVRERRQPVKGMHKVPLDKDVRAITAKIKNTRTAGELLDYADTVVDKPIFNYIHVSAAYTKPGNFQKKGGLSPAEVRSNVLLRLGDRLQGMLARKEVDEQGLSNIIWAFANLFLDVPLVLKRVPALVEQIPGKVGDMIPQHLSNSLWAAAQLQDAAPKILEIVPALVEQIPFKAHDMDPQHVSNSLWAAAKLQDAAPKVLKMVPSVVAQVSLKAKDMIPQHLSNTLWAAAKLQDAAPEVLKVIPALAKQISLKPDDMNAQDLSNNIWAAALLRDAGPDVVKILPAVASEIPLKVTKMVPQQLSNCLWGLKSFAGASHAVQKAVLALVQEIQRQVRRMKPQDLSNTLEALVFRSQSFPIVDQPDIVAASSAQLTRLLPKLKGKDLQFAVPVVVWACSKSNVYDGKLFEAIADRFSSQHLVASMPDWGLCAMWLG